MLQAIIWDKKFRKYAEEYYKDGALSFCPATTTLSSCNHSWANKSPPECPFPATLSTTRLRATNVGEKFAADFAAAFSKLMELGVPFTDEGPGPYVAPPGERPKGETGHATH